MKYNEMVRRLAKTGTDIQVTMTPQRCHWAHMAMGIAGEAGELYCEVSKHGGIEGRAIVKEAGDCLFYLTGLFDHPDGIDLKQGNKAGLEPIGFYGSRDALIQASSAIVDEVKKSIAYNREPNIELLRGAAMRLDAAIHGLVMGLTDVSSLEEVEAANMAKLAERYGDDFEYSDSAAITRKDV